MPIVNTAPPAKATANKSTVKQTAAAKSASDITAARTEAVTALGQFAQVPLMIMKQHADVGAIDLHWKNISGEIAKLAASNEQVAKIVDPLMTVGPYAGIITAVMPLAVQILVNHGRIPAGAAGSVPATTLSSQVESAIAERELQALTIQRDAEQKSAAMRREIENARKILTEETSNA
jgi:hypothetical protein